jgi:hypothetical protein
MNVKICVPEQGKILAVSPDGNISCNEKHGYETDWLLVKIDNGSYNNIITDEYHIVSKNYKLTLEYDIEKGQQIIAEPFNHLKDHTKWNISQNNEIYTIKNGEKYFLWSALGNIYATHDEYLAENWQLLGNEIVKTTKREALDYQFIIPLIIACLLLALLIRRR